MVFHAALIYKINLLFYNRYFAGKKYDGMATRLIIDSSSQLQELKDQSWIVRLLAKIISYVFHPVFVPVYIILFLLYVHPGVFAGFSPFKKTIVLLQALLPYVVLPVVTVFLLKALNFIENVTLVTRKDRIIPYIACNLWYFWIAYVWYNQADYPKEIIILAIGIFISSVIGQLVNIYMKISMHAIAMGLAVSFMLLVALMQTASSGVYVSVSLFIAGLVCTARLLVSNHTQKDIYGGLLSGVAGILIASLFVGIY